MHKSLIPYMATLLSVFTIIVIILKVIDERGYKEAELGTYLRAYNTMLYNNLDYPFSDEVKKNLKKQIAGIPDKDIRVTIFDTAGFFLFDTDIESAIIPNISFFDRKELQEAKEKGEGYTKRKSVLNDKSYYFLVQKFDNYYVRTALPFNENLKSYFSLDKETVYLILIIYLVTILGVIYYRMLHLKTVRQFLDFVSLAEKDEFVKFNRNIGSKELDKVANLIADLYNRYQEKSRLLETEHEKLLQHLTISKEGLAIFNSEGKILNCNDLFIHYINLISNKILEKPEDIFSIPAFKDIYKFLEENQHKKISDIKQKYFEIEIGNLFYRIHVIIFNDNTFEISINEETQKEIRTRIQKQLTENIAHELKTPVTTINGYLETILNTPDISDEQKDSFIEKCFKQSDRLRHLVDEISLLNKMESKSEFFTKEIINITDIILVVIRDTTTEIEKCNVQVKFDFPDKIIIQGNDSLIYSIFRNLVDNSLAYAGNNIVINIKCYYEDENYFYFSYSDTGIGVPKEHLSLIFERFYRIDKGRSRKMGGTGLGLSVVKSAVAFHNGNIIAKKYNERGLEFLFTIGKQ